MKSKLLFLFLFLCTSRILAKEGMWLPFLLERLNEKEMQGMGMKIKAKDIYDINAGSLKDAVVIFGGGCTGEVISEQGLVLTNHHCGYGTVQGLSSVGQNYLSNGFFAPNQQGELPCPGLSVTFIIRIEDVTPGVKAGVTEDMADSVRTKKINENILAIEKQYKSSTGYDASIKSFYADNTYYLFLTEKYTDIRLVAFPPNGIGKFGGDTDNWAWPRHTGDFGVFRIYASPDNKPAAYSAANRPFKPRRSLKINISGVKEKDFTLVYGFPGRTQEYLTASGVQEVMEVLDPIRIKLRHKRLDIMGSAMSNDESIFIKYAAKQASIANYYKKWKGELKGLQVNDAIQKKKLFEKDFRAWVSANQNRNKYTGIIDSLDLSYKNHRESIRLSEYLLEAIWASELVKKGSVFNGILKSLDTMKTLDSLVVYERDMAGFYKGIDLTTDYQITRSLWQVYQNDIGDSNWVSASQIDRIYQYSVLSNPDLFNEFIRLRDKEKIMKLIGQDPVYITFTYFDALQKANNGFLKGRLQKMNRFYSTYMEALQVYYAEKKKPFYPDANSTMRVTYGKVEGLKPQDGMRYEFMTTLDGAIRKADPNAEEFNLPEKLKRLHASKDYGQYAIQQNGQYTVPLAFLASNHTTGGNSGSPVLNAKGELIGTNFDRIWEGTMSDILFDPNLCRTITLDIRYTLFIIEKFGNAKWIVDEMKLVKNL